MSLAFIVACVIVVALIAYALTGGADFGGGVWDLGASGPRKNAQRAVIARAIAPIWEANHVWLIVVVVLLFVGFPRAFAELSIWLHIPLTLMLIGVVLRGSALVFNTYDPQPERASRAWRTVFAVSSTLTPVMLGVNLGAAASGAIRVDGTARPDFLAAWLAPFPFLVGALVLALFALTAAVYLTLEVGSKDRALQEDFRTRALASAVAVGVLAWACVLVARSGAPQLYAGLLTHSYALPFQLVTGACALSLMAALWVRRYQLARLLVGAQVTLLIVGLAGAQYPFLVVPSFLLDEAAAPPAVLRMLLLVLGGGAAVLLPALWYLFRVFKARALPSVSPEDQP